MLKFYFTHSLIIDPLPRWHNVCKAVSLDTNFPIIRDDAAVIAASLAISHYPSSPTCNHCSSPELSWLLTPPRVACGWTWHIFFPLNTRLRNLVIGDVNFVFVNWSGPLMLSRLAQSTHKLAPNLSPSSPSLLKTTAEKTHHYGHWQMAGRSRHYKADRKKTKRRIRQG